MQYNALNFSELTSTKTYLLYLVTNKLIKYNSMKNRLLSLSGVEILSREQQKMIVGQAKIDLSKCGCDCAGSVTGPSYCAGQIACTQGYTCQDAV
jgi:hypothetical protein